MSTADVLGQVRSEARQLPHPVSTRIDEDEWRRLREVASRLNVRVAVIARIAISRTLPDFEQAAEERARGEGLQASGL